MILLIKIVETSGLLVIDERTSRELGARKAAICGSQYLIRAIMLHYMYCHLMDFIAS